MQRKADDLYLIAAAYLSSQQKDQSTIAKSLGISQSLVSRLIDRARKNGILEVKTRFASERVPRDDLARAIAKVQSEPLQEMVARVGTSRPGHRIPVVRVFPSHGRNTTDAAWRHRIQAFSSDCAEDLLRVLTSASVIGIAWGGMVASAVDAIRTIQANRREPRQFEHTIIPLVGEPLGHTITQHSSSVLASKLAETLNNKPEPDSTLSLAPVPAFIPAEMSKPETLAIRKLISLISAYRKIFGSDKSGCKADEGFVPWIQRVDAILTSISTQDWPLGFDFDGLIEAAGIHRERLNDLVVGDLCGVVIPRPNLDRQSKAEIEGIMARWTGVKVEHLEACAKRAENGAPGVIVLAIGANKAALVYEALRRGLIQHLFMDEDLADRLGEICTASSHKS